MGIEINVPALLDQIVRRKAKNGAGRHRLLLKVAHPSATTKAQFVCVCFLLCCSRARRLQKFYVISKFFAYPFYFLLHASLRAPPTELNTPTASPTIPQQIDIAGTVGLFTDWYVQI